MNVPRGKDTLWTIVGVTAGVAAGVWLWTRGREAAWRERLAEAADERGRWVPRGSAQDVALALGSDGKLSRRRIQVDTIAEGVVELSGRVRSRQESQRAVDLAQSTTGVYTVVNRLIIGEEEEHLAEARKRWEDGAPELRERHHYGMGVGMGTRRQSPDTDPDRPSDKQRLIERELDVRKVGMEDAGVADRMDVAAGASRSAESEDGAGGEAEGTMPEPESAESARQAEAPASDVEPEAPGGAGRESTG